MATAKKSRLAPHTGNAEVDAAWQDFDRARLTLCWYYRTGYWVMCIVMAGMLVAGAVFWRTDLFLLPSLIIGVAGYLWDKWFRRKEAALKTSCHQKAAVLDARLDQAIQAGGATVDAMGNMLTMRFLLREMGIRL